LLAAIDRRIAVLSKGVAVTTAPASQPRSAVE
jgi:hypothetical protein